MQIRPAIRVGSKYLGGLEVVNVQENEAEIEIINLHENEEEIEYSPNFVSCKTHGIAETVLQTARDNPRQGSQMKFRPCIIRYLILKMYTRTHKWFYRSRTAYPM